MFDDYNLIDLGLPSKTLWCDRNIGANSIREFGWHFRFGEIFRDTFSIIPFESKIDAETSILKLNRDAAYVMSNRKLKLPSKENCKELVDNCYSEWISDSSFCVGMCLTSKINNNKIFFPAGGMKYIGRDGKIGTDDINEYCVIWSNEWYYGNVYGFKTVSSGSVCVDTFYGNFFYNIRGVANTNN